MDDNNFVTVGKNYFEILEQKAENAEYFRGRVDGLEYVIHVIHSIVEAFNGKENE